MSLATRHGASQTQDSQASQHQTSLVAWQQAPQVRASPLPLLLAKELLKALRIRRTINTYRETSCCLGMSLSSPPRPGVLLVPIPPGPCSSTAHLDLPILCRLSSKPGPGVSQPTPTAICSFALFPSAPHNLPLTVWETEASPFQASRGRETLSQLQPHVLCTFAQVRSPHPTRLLQGLCSGRGEQVKGSISELFNVVFGDPGTGTGPCEHCGILVGLGKHTQ